MPEAVKETEAEAIPIHQSNEEKVVSCGKLVENKPSVACSGTLPSKEEEMKMEIEGEKAPPSDEQSPEESNTFDEKPTKAQIQELLEKGREAVAKHDYYNAADHFGKACEFAAKLYGDMASECAENYFLYGSAMLECGKAENTVLGEKVKDEADEDDEENQDEGNEVTPEEQNGDSQGEQEKDVSEENNKDPGKHANGKSKDDSTDSTVENATGPSSVEVDSKDNDETIDGAEEKEEDEDSSLKVAWEMFELAKVIFQKSGNDKRLADTFMKLGEVGIESGHKTAMDDMKKCLEVRMKLYPGERIVSETHFNIGLAYSMFQLFDEAINHFELCKTILKAKIEQLHNAEGSDVKDEIKEIEDLLPDLDEKIQDMKESKKIHEEEMMKNETANKEEPSKEETGEKSKISDASLPASNISHLVKRKRKLDEVTSDLSPEENRKSKLVCKEEEKGEEMKISNMEEKDTGSGDGTTNEVTEEVK